MTTQLETLRRELRNVRTLAYRHYDRFEADRASLMSLLCLTVDNRTQRDNPVRLDEVFFHPVATAWEDEIEAGQALDKIDFVVPIKGYDAFFPYNQVNIGRPSQVAVLERLVARLPEALDRLHVGKAMQVFRTNPLSITGQNFFSTAHPRPADQGTYSNVLPVDWADPAAPTTDEVKALLDALRVRFVDIATVDSEVVDDDKFDEALTLIVHNPTHWGVLRQVRDKAKLADEENEHRGTFRLLRDLRPTAGQETWLEAVLSLPSSPRPVLRVLDQDPRLDAWESNRVLNGYVAVGYKTQFGMKPGYPETTVQVRPS